MTINDVSLRAGASRPLPFDKPRVEEVQRLAQGAAAAQFVGIPAQLQNGNSSQIDSASISREAIEEISRFGNSSELQRTDQLVSALRLAFESSTGQQDPSGSGRSQEQLAQTKPEETTATPASVKKRAAHWEPPGQSDAGHPQGRELLGQIVIKADPAEGAESANSGSRTTLSGGVGRPISWQDSGNSTLGSSSREFGATSSSGHGLTVSDRLFTAAGYA